MLMAILFFFCLRKIVSRLSNDYSRNNLVTISLISIFAQYLILLARERISISSVILNAFEQSTIYTGIVIQSRLTCKQVEPLPLSYRITSNTSSHSNETANKLV